MMMTLAQAHAMLPAATLVGNSAVALDRVHTDTRTLRAGDLFVALRGERFDGHNFLAQARAAGAVAAIAERGLAESQLPGLLVADSLRALQELAAAWRARVSLPLIAVTGSNGKTTVTQMLASILRAWCGDAALATSGNLNNHIGVPLTVLRLRPQHRAAVVELGMNHAGEIALLARIAAPTVTLVNNAQREHQEFMASVEAVARENGAAIEVLPTSGVAVFPADDAMAPIWRAQAGARRQLTFATRGGADITASAAWADDHWALRARTPAGEAELAVHAAGAHNVHNALAATTAALAAGAPIGAIREGLDRFRPVAGRSRLLSWQRGGARVALVDDSYNANPDSVRAAIDLLAGLPGPHWLVLGDMGEVGAKGPEFHREVGAYARERGIEHLWVAGALCEHTAQAFGAAARHFADAPEVIAALSEAPPCASALVKGSRFMGMERVVRALVQQEGSHAH
ncbi:MAG TPA: UDP-N-acetylmuramoyl-tripeptide--D-alanyl-D-alanine ligase [Burkholderiaceae bacterium]|nr:UDP-N-acetylmuramoyl-tripeptide--D-alanyl-D-alanine ligase [Burkholderiaceae bacterium]